MKVKLSKKQLENLQNTQAQKQQLSTALADVNQREALIIDLILEMYNIDPGNVTDLKLEGEFLTYEEVKPKAKNVSKKSQVEPVS